MYRKQDETKASQNSNPWSLTLMDSKLVTNCLGMAPRVIVRTRLYVKMFRSEGPKILFRVNSFCSFIAWNNKISSHFEMFRLPYVDVDWVSTYHQLAPPFQQIIDIWESWRGLFVGLGSERVNDCSEVMLCKNVPSEFRSDGIRLLFHSRQRGRGA